MAQNIDKILNNVLGITTAAMLVTVAAAGVSGGYYSHVKYGSFNVLKAANYEKNLKSLVQKNKNLLNSRNFEAVKDFMDLGARMRMLIAFPQKDANGTIVGWDFRAYYISDTEGLVESTIDCALPVIDGNGNITFGNMRQGIALQEWEELKQRLEKCGCKFDLDAVSQFLKDKEEQIRKAELQAEALRKVEEAKKLAEKYMKF